MRIIAGRFKGLGLAAVGKGDMGAHLRPTTDRVRESLFAILEGGRFGEPIDGVRVLDLFAGTGALGLEALSRGAAHVTFVENGRVSLKLLTENIDRTKARGETRLIRTDATRLTDADADPASLVFLDPPYGTDLGARALANARKRGWIAEDALIVWEDSSEQNAPTGFKRIETRRFGATWLTFLGINDTASET